MRHPRAAVGASVFGALVLTLVGCTAVEREAGPTPTPTVETVVQVSTSGPAITGTGPTEPYPGVDFPLPDHARTVTIDFECEGGLNFHIELGDPMAAGDAALRGTCDGITSLTWPVTDETAPKLFVWTPDGVAWSATPHYSTAEFIRNEAITAECEAFSAVYSELSNADIGLTEYQAFDEAEWKRRVDAAAAELETLADTSETTMAEPFDALLTWVRDGGHAPGTLVTDVSLIDPISDTCNTNHTPLILMGEFGG
ncbi:MAG: hypothetical protein K0R99_2463 [Microbacterium sp.]|jgi:hypothetical protein|uniref:hypothetical protein n=1 Tax=Microbacterium sp. TaxID=51671 RepID=UPI002629D718|nr:hypothetical protein [Microbacterium sp.]MDF2561017.1 hypothetical protein [Microbacterium sp.]